MKRSAIIILVVFIAFLLQGLIHGAIPIPSSERAALIALYNSTDGDSWADNSGWKDGALYLDGFAWPGTEGDWKGVTVEFVLVGFEFVNSVTKIDLNCNLLTGSIPTQLGTLTNLTKLYLYSNQLTGSIPPELGNLSNLEQLNISHNQLTGSIPSVLGNLSNLEQLKINHNQLSGSMPSSLGNLNNLRGLILIGNKLSGNIPEELGNLSNLGTLELDNNQLSGSIPSSLGNLSNLSGLFLSSNQLGGSIPSNLGNLSILGMLELQGNQLSGSIPASFTNLTNLSSTYTNIGYNALYTNDSTLQMFLNSKDPDWEETQTIAPSNVSAAAISSSSIKVSWSAITYTGNTGGYKVYYSTTSGSPYTYYGITADKSVTSLTVSGLSPGTTYYLVVKTKTDSHAKNSNTVESEYSSEASATTQNIAGTYTLNVQSSPHTGATITVSPNDRNGDGNGSTNFTRIYNSGTSVTLTAPPTHQGNTFSKWTVGSTEYPSESVQVTMTSSKTATAFYVSSAPPEISLNRLQLNFGATTAGIATSSQSILVGNSGGGFLNWSVADDQTWLSCTPSSGNGSGTVTVSVSPSGLSTGTYTGTIAVSDASASNSPQTVSVTLKVYRSGGSSVPSGVFETPLEGSTVSSSIPVTGWVVDDIEVISVKIYNGSSYVGDAVFVEGARPDVEQAYSTYPKSYEAGWGYMMLTNFLPNGGNGYYTFYAKATDAEGNQVTLGSKTITCDNANAVKPFGAIDTPTQGGTASGSSFINWGWVLTPQPNSIPFDGSTINVFVDSVYLGHPTYNNYRGDIATLFPGYANSNGAVGYFSLNTTAYNNGVHTIFWIAIDSGGNTDGIGSRYFSIQNLGVSGQLSVASSGPSSQWSVSKKQNLSKIRIDNSSPVWVLKGYERNIKPFKNYPDDEGIITLEIKELERIEIHLADNLAEVKAKVVGDSSDNSKFYSGYMLAGNKIHPLPLGSTLDSENGIFYWTPGPGFYGNYRLVFIVKDQNGELSKKEILVNIVPKFGIKK